MKPLMSGASCPFGRFRYALERQPFFERRAKSYEDDSAKGQQGKIACKQLRYELLNVSDAKCWCKKPPSFVVVDVRGLNQLEYEFGAFHSVAKNDYI